MCYNSFNATTVLTCAQRKTKMPDNKYFPANSIKPMRKIQVKLACLNFPTQSDTPLLNEEKNKFKYIKLLS
jgi:hypothetical protein